MSNFEGFMAAVLVGMLGFQAWLTRRVLKSQAFEREQVWNQVRLIWFLPLLGAAIVYSVHQQERQAAESAATRSAERR